MVEKKKILLVEDSRDDVDLIKRIVWRYFGPDQVIDHCASMCDAEQYVHEGAASVRTVLLDLGLPDTANAVETFQRMKRFSSEIPVVVLTGSQDYSLALRLVEEGAEDFVCKGRLLQAPDMLRNAMEFSVRRHELVRANGKKAREAADEKDMLLSWMNGGYSVQGAGKT
jgi:DNA-binding NtrC family response regulator